MTNWEKIFATYMAGRGPNSLIYKKLLQINKKKLNIPMENKMSYGH